MKKIRNILIWSFMVLFICGIIFGIGLIKYKFWRAEHPQAKTWTFFIPNGNN